MKPARRGAVVAFAVGAAVVLPLDAFPHAHAVQRVESAWWTRTFPAAPADAGIQVSSDPSGPSAVAAVRIVLDEGEAQPALRLTVTLDGAAPDTPLVACTSGRSWQPVQGGAWDQRPPADCERGSVAATREPEAFVLDLAGMPADGGVVDVVLFVGEIPVPVAPGLFVSPFATFVLEAPDAADVSTTSRSTNAAPSDTPLPDPVVDPAPTFAAPGDALALPDAGLPSPALGRSSGAERRERPNAGTGVGSAPLVAPIRRAAESVGQLRDRFIAGMVFLDLCALWWLLNRRRGDHPDAVRPRLTLHDDPTIVPALAGASRRARGDAPPLR